MRKLQDICNLASGSPQFRVTASKDFNARTYKYYAQPELENDLIGMETMPEESKIIQTLDKISTTAEGDVLFSLISGRCSMVRSNHEGYFFTQNYVKIIPSEKLDKKYLVYLLNEDAFIKKQWQINLQGSVVIKYTVNQLKELQFPELPPYEEQVMIGNIYFKQIRLQALKERVAATESKLVLAKLKGVWHERGEI